MESFLLFGVAVTALLLTLTVLLVQCLAVVGELLGGTVMLLFEPFGDPGFKLIKLGLLIVQELMSRGDLDLHVLQTLELSSSFSLPECYSRLPRGEFSLLLRQGAFPLLDIQAILFYHALGEGHNALANQKTVDLRK
jgi:hypothetical protein